MSNYRPICDVWLLARCKYKGGVKRYGGYLGGFPERARVLIGCPLDQPLLHVCGGLANYYPYKRGFGPLDKRMDLDKSVSPDFLMDCRDPDWPKGILIADKFYPWGGILIDSAYTPDDQKKYCPAVQGKYPSPHLLVKNAIAALNSGYKVGIIHYELPKCPPNAVFIANVKIDCGFANRSRTFNVYEKIPDAWIVPKKKRTRPQPQSEAELTFETA